MVRTSRSDRAVLDRRYGIRSPCSPSMAESWLNFSKASREYFTAILKNTGIKLARPDQKAIKCCLLLSTSSKKGRLLPGVRVSNLTESRRFMTFVAYIFFNCWLLFTYSRIKPCASISFLKDAVLNNRYHGNSLNSFWLISMTTLTAWMKRWASLSGDKSLKAPRRLLKHTTPTPVTTKTKSLQCFNSKQLTLL